ncbi:MAG: hypothetical protein D6828_04300, partial [Nitrospirae bacterium]
MEIGIVKEIIDGVAAKVIILKNHQSNCESCCSSSCSASPEMEVEALNPVGAEVGHKVEVSMKPYTYLKGVLIVYALPVLLFFLAAILGKYIGDVYIKEINPDLISAGAAFSTLIITYVIIKIWSMKISKKKKRRYAVIEKII